MCCTGSDRPLPSSGGSEEEAMDHCPLTAEEVRETEMGSSPEQEERAVSSDLSPEESSEGTSPDEPQKLPSSENRDTVWRSVCGKTVTKPTTTNPHSPSSATTELAGLYICMYVCICACIQSKFKHEYKEVVVTDYEAGIA